jgi:limonene-1,2-epoxide hydrolase
VTSATSTVEQFIAAFMAAWPRADADAVADHFAPDANYHNIPLAPVRGRAAIADTLSSFMALGGVIGVDIRHIVGDGPIVMTERIDHLTDDTGTRSLPVMGIFEVHDGLITSWRDYFDLDHFLRQLSPAPD